jgi:hypothetical protein
MDCPCFFVAMFPGITLVVTACIMFVYPNIATICTVMITENTLCLSSLIQYGTCDIRYMYTANNRQIDIRKSCIPCPEDGSKIGYPYQKTIFYNRWDPSNYSFDRFGSFKMGIGLLTTGCIWLLLVFTWYLVCRWRARQHTPHIDLQPMHLEPTRTHVETPAYNIAWTEASVKNGYSVEIARSSCHPDVVHVVQHP